MSRIVAVVGVFCLVMGAAACKAQTERDLDETATGVQGARSSERGGDEVPTGSESASEWEDEERMRAGSSAQEGGFIGAGGGDEAGVVTVQLKAPYGNYLADSSGMSLYTFAVDERGEPSSCRDACEEAWPPFILEGGIGTTEALSVPEQLDESRLATAARRDGRMQITYNGLPLYYYAQDESPGDTKGQDVEEFGGAWYLMAPDGEAIDNDGESDAEILEDIGEANEMD